MTTDFGNLRLSEVQKRYETLELEKIMYCSKESGWVKRWDESHVIIANVPFFAQLSVFDIVTVKTSNDGRPMVNQVVWRGYTKHVRINYPSGTAEQAKRFFEAIGKAVRAQNMRIEGAFPGMCKVNCQDGDDVTAVLTAAFAEAHIDMTGIKINDPEFCAELFESADNEEDE